MWPEVWRVISLSIPYAWGELSSHGCNITDLLFLGHLGSRELGSAGLVIAYMTLTSLPTFAIAGTLTIVASQSFGAQQQLQADLWFQRATLLSLFVGVFVGLSWFYAGWFLSIINPALEPLGAQYAWWSLPRLPGQIMARLVSAYLEAQQITQPITVSSCLCVLCNVLFNYVLIEGFGSFPGLGFIGSPLATTLTIYLDLAVLLWMARRIQPPDEEDAALDSTLKNLVKDSSFFANEPVNVLPSFQFSLRAISARQFGAFLQLALPKCATMLLEDMCFNVMNFTAGRIGVIAMAANTVVLQSYELAWCFFSGVAQAACVRVGNAVGGARIEDGKTTANVSVCIGLVLALMLAALVTFFRAQLVRLFSIDDEVVQTAVQVLPVAVLAYFSDSVQVIVNGGILEGLGATKVAALCTLVMALCSPLAYLFAMRWGFVGLWLAWVVATVCGAGVSAVSWQRADWEAATEDADDRAEGDDLVEP